MPLLPSLRSQLKILFVKSLAKTYDFIDEVIDITVPVHIAVLDQTARDVVKSAELF